MLFSESAQKGAHFIELCGQRNLPLVFLQNITGFMVGVNTRTKASRNDGAKMVTAVALRSAEVHGHHRRVIRGRQLRHVRARLGPRFLWMWPNARISVMGGEQAAMCWRPSGATIEAKRGVWSAEEEKKFKAPILEQYEHQGHPYYATARLWDDGVIDPLETRESLALALSATLNAPIPDTKFGVFRM